MNEPNHARNAAKKNARLRAELPLFADQLPQHTAESEYWNWRKNKAFAGEGGGPGDRAALALDFLREQKLRRLVAGLIGTETADKLHAYCHRTYPGPEYWLAFWAKVMRGERVVFSHKLVFDRLPSQYNLDGRRVVDDEVYEGTPLFDEETIKALVWPDWTPGPHDDLGLAGRFAEAMTCKAGT